MFNKLTLTLLIVFCAQIYAQNALPANWGFCYVTPGAPSLLEHVEICIKNCKIAQNELPTNLTSSNVTSEEPLQESEEEKLCVKNCKAAQDVLQAILNPPKVETQTPVQSEVELCIKNCETAQNTLQANSSSSNVTSETPLQSEELELCVKNCRTTQNALPTNSSSLNITPEEHLRSKEAEPCTECETAQSPLQTNISSPDVTTEKPLTPEVVEPLQPEVVEPLQSEVVKPVQKELQANWSPCSAVPKGGIQSEEVELYITNCTTAQPECKLYRGQSPKLIIKFKSKKSFKQVERVIIADIFMARLKKKVQIPYGPIVDPCPTMIANDDNTNCESTGVVEDKSYSYASEFKVLDDFPQVNGIEVRVILRAKIANQKNAKRWKSHSGPLFVCAEIHNVAVV